MTRHDICRATMAVVACSALAALGESPCSPNVLFIIVDDLTTTLSCYGHPAARTPHLDALASRGVRFETVYCQFSLCNPARASFLTGCYPARTRVFDLTTSLRDALPDVVTLPQHFRNHGWRTASIGKVFHVADPGTQHDVLHRAPLAMDARILEEAKRNDPTDPPRRGGRHEKYNRPYACVERPDQDFTDHAIAERTIETLREFREGRWFVSVGFIRPHTPFVAPKWAFDAIDRSKIRLPPAYREGGEDKSKIPRSALRPNNNLFLYEPPTAEQAVDAIHAYLAAVHFVDHQIGRVLAELDRLGLASNTYVVATGDNGYQLGEHGLWAKQTLFEEGARVPLIIAGPGIGRGVCRALAEQVDIYPTLVELAGLPRPAHLQGTNLTPWLNEPGRAGRVAVFSTMVAGHTGAMGHSVRNSRYLYIEWSGGKDGVQLYDLSSDPDQVNNLAGDAGHAAMQRRLKRLLDEHLAKVSR